MSKNRAPLIDDLRTQLQTLEEWGEVWHFPQEVDPRFGLPAVCKKYQAGKALFFGKVKNYTTPVVVGMDNNRSRIARVFGTDDFGLTPLFVEALRHPLRPVVVRDGPVKEVRILKDIHLMKALPIVTHYEKDGGPYITAGVVIAEDKKQGVRNLSYHRMQVTGPDEIRILIQPRHLWNLYREREKEGKSLEVAIAIGLDTGIRLAGAIGGSQIPLGFDELSIAGALRRSPVEIIPGETVDVMVPAKSEIILEGEILPNERKIEGPCADFTGTYGMPSEAPVCKVKAMTHRRNPIYQDLLCSTPEHHLILALPCEPILYQAVKKKVPGTLAVHLTPGGCGRFHGVVCIRKRQEEDGKEAILAGLASLAPLKWITVVDEDVNPFDPAEVEWALATRFQADRDLVVLSGVEGSERDPSSPQKGKTAKIGLDATQPLGGKEQFEKVSIPEVGNVWLRSELEP